MIVRGESTIIDYHAPFDQGFRLDKNQSELEVSVEIIPGHTSNGQYL